MNRRMPDASTWWIGWPADGARPRSLLVRARARRPRARRGLIPGILLGGHLRRRTLALGDHDEAVGLIHRPLHIRHHVLSHHGELPRVSPDALVLGHGDRDQLLARFLPTLAHDANV